MRKKTMSQEQYHNILREAEEVAALTRMPGWQVIVGDLNEQMEQLSRVLTENRLRTYEETIETKTGHRSVITTAETQIAENAGMYKMCQHVLDLVERITQGPQKLHHMRDQGFITIAGEKPPEEKKEGGETT